MYYKTKIAIFTITLHTFILAGILGKLSGLVTSEAGEPLIGVNIIIVETELGTASGETGDYFILNILPGRYTVKFMMIGYKTSIQKEVVIRSDFNTRLDVSLEQTVLEAGEEVVVFATRPLIQRDATSKVTVVDADEIINMPVVDFKDVLVTQAGFTTDASGGIHVRGGRTKEILYMIDGIIVKDPLLGDFTGSVNQNGEVQAIGGVNEKIEGFFDCCMKQTLTGAQGVMIPESNAKDLMLRKDVVEAVKKKKFRVYAVKTIDEGIEILTGKTAGVLKADGTYPKNTINYLVNNKLNELAVGLKNFAEEEEKEENKAGKKGRCSC